MVQARGVRGAPIATKARLTYFQENYLQLELQYKSEDQWILCFNVPNVTLPQITYLGFTAETGELSGNVPSFLPSAMRSANARPDNHDIITVTSKNLYQVNTGSGGSGSKHPAKADKASMWKPNNGGGSKSESSGWGLFFLKMIIFVVVIIGGYVGYTVYRTQNRASRF